jgi:hypothetical protein
LGDNQFWIKVIESVVALLSALAWPAALLLIAWMFKGKLEALLDRIKLLKGAGLEAEFGQEAKMALAEAKEAIPEPVPEPPKPPNESSDLSSGAVEVAKARLRASESYAGAAPRKDSADIPGAKPGTKVHSAPVGYRWLFDHRGVAAPPSVVIQGTWREVEEALSRLIEARKIKLDPRVSQSSISWLTALERNNVIDPAIAEVVRDLRSLRNKVVHGSDFEPTPESTIDFVQAATKVIAHMQFLIDQEGGGPTTSDEGKNERTPPPDGVNN